MATGFVKLIRLRSHDRMYKKNVGLPAVKKTKNKTFEYNMAQYADEYLKVLKKSVKKNKVQRHFLFVLFCCIFFKKSIYEKLYDL